MPPLVKLFIAVLTRPEVESNYVTDILSEVFGSVDFKGPSRQFDVTTYYEEEMGSGLQRYIVGFTGPHLADILVGAKLACIEIEKGSASEGNRTLNLDVGYLDHNKIVLASTKGAGHKLYIDSGIYADYVARYSRGAYQPFEWTFPDFSDGRYNQEFATLRASLLQRGKQNHE